MKWAVKLKDNHYACPCCEFALSFADAATTDDRGQAKALAKARGGRVVRILSHEEAKRKAAAMALLALAKEFREAAPFYRKRPFESGAAAGLLDAARHAEAEAEKLWPVLFHAGDGRRPRGK